MRSAGRHLMPIAGLLLMAGGLVGPWLRVPLEHTRSAWSLPIVSTSLPTKGSASYGAAVAICLVGGGAALAWRRGHSLAPVAIAGLGAALLALFFVVQTVISDHQLVGHMTDQQAEYTAIVNQFGYPAPRNQLTSLLVVPLSGPWQVVLSSLRPGWYLALAGGLVLFVRGFQDLKAWAQSRRWWAAAGLAALVLALLLSVGRGVAANQLIHSADDSLQAGDYNTALSRVNLAEHLNPELSFDSRTALVRGQALVSTGDQTSSLALLYIASLRDSVHDEVGALEALQVAAARDPNNVVIVANLLDEARVLAVERSDPGVLQGIVDKPFGDRLAEHYTLGRILYARSDFDRARLQMIHAAEQSAADANVASSAHTYIALSEERIGDIAPARQELLTAVHLDTQYINSLARSLAAGLYISGSF